MTDRDYIIEVRQELFMLQYGETMKCHISDNDILQCKAVKMTVDKCVKYLL